MPPKKAKDEINKPETVNTANKTTLKLESSPVQVQNTKFEGIVLLSPAAQQLHKDLNSAVEDNISSTNKKCHGSINHLRMRELMEPDKDVDEVEEHLVSKLKASILVDLQGIREEIVTSFNSAAYDILQDVLSEHLPKVLQENEALKSMISHLTEQVSNLHQEISALKFKPHSVERSSVHSENNLQSGPTQQKIAFTATERLTTDKGNLPDPATQVNEFEKLPDSKFISPQIKYLQNSQWASPEEDFEYERESSNGMIIFNEDFPDFPMGIAPGTNFQSKINTFSLQNPNKIILNSKPAYSQVARGWGIAAAKIPTVASRHPREINSNLTNLEISGDLPDFQNNFEENANFLLSILNSRLCPILSSDLQRDLCIQDFSNIVNITSHRKVKTWLFKFVDPQLTDFVYQKRRKLSIADQHSDSSFPKFFINPTLNPEDKHNQIKVLKAFNSLTYIDEQTKEAFQPSLKAL